MKQLTLILTCTDRKAIAPPPQLTARSLPAVSVEERCGLWTERMSTTDTATIPLEDLYKGDSWVQQRNVVRMAEGKAQTHALVASAGLGLQDLGSSHPSYAATFAPGHLDTVCAPNDSTVWWAGLQEETGGYQVAQLRGRVLAILSTPYARAMDQDLRLLASLADVEVLLIGGWKDIPGITRIPADRTLRKALGGTVGSLLPRMAKQWLDLWDGAALDSDSAQARWKEWTESARVHEQYSRKPMSDREVLDVIGQLRLKDPQISATLALRMLRDAGSACEQKRFGRLFASAREVAA